MIRQAITFEMLSNYKNKIQSTGTGQQAVLFHLRGKIINKKCLSRDNDGKGITG